jgi:plastocyanin
MHSAVLSGVVLTIVLAACGGGGGNGGTPPPPPPVFTSLRISPASAAMVDGDTLQMTATALDQNGTAITGLGTPTFDRISGTAVSVAANGRVIADQPGVAQIRAALTSGTTTRADTADAAVSALSTNETVTASGTGTNFNPSTVKIAVNGRVTWSFPGPETHNVTFDGAAPAGGNIPNSNSGTEFRDFATVGHYPYHCTRPGHAGMTGVVIVRTP